MAHESEMIQFDFMPDQAFESFENEFLASFSRFPIYSLVRQFLFLMKTPLVSRQSSQRPSRFQVHLLGFETF